MADIMLDTNWQAAFPNRSRPELYAKGAGHHGDGFRPLTDANDFLVDNLQSLSQAQLYALTENNALALRLAQEEWTKLERLAQQIKTRDALLPITKDPQQLPSREIFEERKEAVLYGYKYEANRKILPARFTVPEQITDQEKFDCREPPEPFAQGGLIPNEKQYKSILVAARNEGRESNPDNQKSSKENFAFEDLPAGTWIAKTLAPELPPPPRTRARVATLNGASERQTRFNGEKVPMTRQLSSNTLNTASPGKRTGTPLGGQSPALGKRKIDATDITAEVPRKKHPNQYTKAREERERLEREAALKAAGVEISLVNGDIAVPVPVRSLEPVPVKKKHPNQYTKRREREEEERRRREEEEEARAREQALGLPQTNELPPRPYYWQSSMSRPMVDQNYQPRPYQPPSMYPGAHPFPEGMSQLPYPNYNSYGHSDAMQHLSMHRAPERPKHPNQHTKRKEREAAAAAAIALEHVMSGQPGPPPNVRMAAAGTQAIHHPSQTVVSRQSTPLSQPQATSQSTRGRDPSTMTKEELVVHPFKDHELVAFLQKDHSWLNEDPEKAETWKKRILASDYPVRTWAMFRKWREWRSDGKDKRPRDKDGKRIKQAQLTSTTTETAAQNLSGTMRSDQSREVVMVDAPPVLQQNHAPLIITKPSYVDSNSASLPASPVKSTRPFKTRLDTGRLGSPFPQMPGSPLVNGINARDLDDSLPSASAIDTEPAILATEAQATSFKQRLSSFHEVDPATKVNIWQDKTETDYAASTYAGKGVLKQHPAAQRALRPTRASSRSRSQAVSTDDASVASQAIPNNNLRCEDSPILPQPVQAQSENTVSSASEDEESESNSDSSAAPSDSNDKDGEYGSRTRARKSTRNNRAVRATKPNIGAAMERTVSTRSTRSMQQNKAISVQDNDAVASLTLTRTRSGEQGRTRSERTASPTVSRRTGLRPNLGKRTYTGDSEVSGAGDAGIVPTRRSLRSIGEGMGGL